MSVMLFVPEWLSDMIVRISEKSKVQCIIAVTAVNSSDPTPIVPARVKILLTNRLLNNTVLARWYTWPRIEFTHAFSHRRT